MIPQTAPRAESATPPPGAGLGSSPPPAASSFDFNQPTIVSLLYLSSFLLGVTSIVGVVLAYVWKGDAKAEWEVSHYQYLINTFWIGLIGGVVSVFLMLLLIGFLLLPAVMVLVVVRCVLSLINAQKQVPMPNPGTWLA
jgi:uncharacterized membrane protein